MVVEAWKTDGRWPELHDFDAVVVFGGAMSSVDEEHYPFLAEERSLMRRAVDLGMPTLGICLGAQLLALACDAPVTIAPERECGFRPLRMVGEGASDAVLAPFPDGSLAFQWHEDTFDPPDGATLLAVGATGGNQAYRVGSALAVQFHPDITNDELELWIVEAGDSLEAVWGREPDDFRAEIAQEIAVHNERGRAFFRAFAREAMAAGTRRSA